MHPRPEAGGRRHGLGGELGTEGGELAKPVIGASGSSGFGTVPGSAAPAGTFTGFLSPRRAFGSALL